MKPLIATAATAALLFFSPPIEATGEATENACEGRDCAASAAPTDTADRGLPPERFLACSVAPPPETVASWLLLAGAAVGVGLLRRRCASQWRVH